jgi:hypothetical protein
MFWRLVRDCNPCPTVYYMTTFTVIHPYYKLHYIEMVWGGEKEQAAEIAVGNPFAKNWQQEAWKIIEETVGDLI